MRHYDLTCDGTERRFLVVEERENEICFTEGTLVAEVTLMADYLVLPKVSKSTIS